jgi:Secretion system C-terminal sorting domain
MKQIIIISLLVTTLQLNAQLHITNGAEIKMTGTAILSLQDIDLVNEGIFNQAEGTVHFSGNTNTNISGTQTTGFNILEVAKGINNRLLLQRNINADNQISFITGYLDLNGFNISLAPNALLIGEAESSRIVGATGGYIEIINTLNAPSAINPGNLGAILTSAVNMGSTIIRRGHQSQVNGAGGGNSVNRYFDITPANNTGLNATFRFKYFDTELNGLAENTLTMWKSNNTTSWTNENFTSRDLFTNYVEKTGVAGFSRWTLSSPGNALPITGLVLSGQWQNNAAKLRWKTETEINNHHFTVQRYYQNSQHQFSDVAIIPTKHSGGNSVSTTWYDYTDVTAAATQGSVFYRIQQVDINTRFSFSNTIRLSPNGVLLFIDKVYPTVVQSQLNIQIGNAPLNKITVTIHDMAGRLVLQKTVPYQSQQLALPAISNGMYHLKIQSGTWEYKSSFIKQ